TEMPRCAGVDQPLPAVRRSPRRGRRVGMLLHEGCAGVDCGRCGPEGGGVVVDSCTYETRSETSIGVRVVGGRTDVARMLWMTNGVPVLGVALSFGVSSFVAVLARRPVGPVAVLVLVSATTGVACSSHKCGLSARCGAGEGDCLVLTTFLRQEGSGHEVEGEVSYGAHAES